VLKLASLFAARHTILSQAIAVRSRTRPFRLGRQQISFVATDIGNSGYVPDVEEEEARLHVGSSLPPEVRKALVELGFDRDAATRTTTARQQLPLSALPSSYIEPQGPAASTTASSSAQLLRRKSSSGQRSNTARRPVLVAAVSSLLLRAADLLLDPDAGVAATARDAVFTFSELVTYFFQSRCG
jgi:hypothetical protein